MSSPGVDQEGKIRLIIRMNITSLCFFLKMTVLCSWPDARKGLKLLSYTCYGYRRAADINGLLHKVKEADTNFTLIRRLHYTAKSASPYSVHLGTIKTDRPPTEEMLGPVRLIPGSEQAEGQILVDDDDDDH
jgi:hypothetical protein